jgi:4-diphosphocytidyl-2-C-methyl-D-erythritol kinase
VSSETPGMVTVRAPGKVNLALHVGSPDLTGFHPLLTAFQAVDMWDSVSVVPDDEMTIEIRAGFDVSSIPLDESNLVWRAHQLINEHLGEIPPSRITIDKAIPVSGGMAGGSADAAAAVIALAELNSLGPDTTHLRDLCRALGSDVPFSLVGGSAVGRGRGDVLEPFRIEQPLSLIIVSSDQTLSTPDSLGDDFLHAWREGDAIALAPLLHNDLQPAAVSMMPVLQRVLDDTAAADALTAIVSGSGPTVIGLARDLEHASEVAAKLTEQNYRATAVQTTSLGTHRSQ